MCIDIYIYIWGTISHILHCTMLVCFFWRPLPSHSTELLRAPGPCGDGFPAPPIGRFRPGFRGAAMDGRID